MQNSQKLAKAYNVKVVFIIDITKSMQKSIDAVQRFIHTVINKTLHQFPGMSIKFAFVGYRDVEDDNQFVIIEFTDIDKIQSAFEDARLIATGGYDIPENVLGGMEKAIQLDWSQAQVKLAIHIADAPHHGKKFCEEFIDDSHPHLQNKPRPSDEILRDFAEKKIDYYFYQVKVKTNIGYRFITKKMADVFKEEYDQCVKRTKDFTVSTFDTTNDASIDTFFQAVMENVSLSVIDFMERRDTAKRFTRPSFSNLQQEKEVIIPVIIDPQSPSSTQSTPKAPGSIDKIIDDSNKVLPSRVIPPKKRPIVPQEPEEVEQSKRTRTGNFIENLFDYADQVLVGDQNSDD